MNKGEQTHWTTQARGKSETLQGILPACSKWGVHKVLPATKGRYETITGHWRKNYALSQVLTAKPHTSSFIVELYQSSLHRTSVRTDPTSQMLSERISPFQIFLLVFKIQIRNKFNVFAKSKKVSCVPRHTEEIGSPMNSRVMYSIFLWTRASILIYFITEWGLRWLSSLSVLITFLSRSSLTSPRRRCWLQHVSPRAWLGSQPKAITADVRWPNLRQLPMQVHTFVISIFTFLSNSLEISQCIHAWEGEWGQACPSTSWLPGVSFLCIGRKISVR